MVTVSGQPSSCHLGLPSDAQGPSEFLLSGCFHSLKLHECLTPLYSSSTLGNPWPHPLVEDKSAEGLPSQVGHGPAHQGACIQSQFSTTNKTLTRGLMVQHCTSVSAGPLQPSGHHLQPSPHVGTEKMSCRYCLRHNSLHCCTHGQQIIANLGFLV